MDKYIFQDVSRIERLKLLKDNAHKTSIEDYYLELELNEISEREHNYSQQAIKLQELEVEFKQIKAQYTEETKSLKGDMQNILHELETGKRYVKSECYLIPDYDNNLMGYYTVSGLLVKSRDLDEEDYQLRIT